MKKWQKIMGTIALAALAILNMISKIINPEFSTTASFSVFWN